MKLRIVVISAVAFFLACNAIGAENNPPASPSALIPQPIHEFEQVVDGTQVIYDYFIQNKGTAPLEVQKIKTG